MALISDPITAVVEAGTALMNKFWPDAGEEERQKMTMFLTVFTAQAQIIQTEAASNHWLAANWRPLTMITFVGLIVARWFGWAAPNLSQEEYLMLWGIVKLGLGGYTVGRTVEKVAPGIMNAISNRSK